MIKYERSKSSMFLLEIIINILLFSFMCICSLQFFAKSYQLTQNTTILHHAVTSCNNVASVFKAGEGSTDAILNAFPDAILENGCVYIYFDKNYQECDAKNCHYYITVEKMKFYFPCICITFYKTGNDATYSIDVYYYTPIKPMDVLSSSTENTSSYYSVDVPNESEVSVRE